MQSSTEIPVFGNCACVKLFQGKLEIGSTLTSKTGNVLFVLGDLATALKTKENVN